MTVSLSTAFGCPIEGKAAQDAMLRWADRCAEIGVRGLTVAALEQARQGNARMQRGSAGGPRTLVSAMYPFMFIRFDSKG